MPGERAKVIRIRVSEEDFKTLSEVCQQKGKGTVGELMRDELYHLVSTYEETALKGADTRLWFLELVRRLTGVQGEVERLEELPQGAEIACWIYWIDCIALVTVSEG